jgi:NAD(P)H-nitrite reductase large subunit
MKSDGFCKAAQEYKMDKDFLRLIETVDELIPQATEKLDDETLICECFCVNVKDIRELCQTHVDIDLLQDQLNMGQGCQSCMKNKDSWKNKIF